MLMHFNHESEGAISQSVSIPSSNDFSNPLSPPDLRYSGAQFNADGNLYARQFNGGWTRIGSWLKSGLSGSFYISRSITAGTLTTDAGAGPLVMSTNRIYDLQETDAVALSVITFSISDDISGSPVVDSESFTFSLF